MSNLRECGFDHRVLTTGDVVKASHVVVRYGDFPVRVVLRNKGTNGEGKKEYAVSKEILELDRDPQRNHLSCPLKHRDFIEGNYTTNYERALDLFHDRVGKL